MHFTCATVTLTQRYGSVQRTTRSTRVAFVAMDTYRRYQHNQLCAVLSRRLFHERLPLTVRVTLRDCVRLLVLVRLHVLAQVITAHEALAAYVTREPFLARVSPYVPLELVGSREPFAAEQPVTDERALPRVPAKVRLQVRRLVVHLAATGNVARVHVALAHATGRLEPVGLLAVWAVTRRPTRVAALRARVCQRSSETRMCEEAPAGGHVGTEAGGSDGAVQHRLVPVGDEVLLGGCGERRRVSAAQLTQGVVAVRVRQR